MSETSQFREPVILGLSPYQNPLLNPETGELESAFSPLPGEEVPPADLLAEVFPPRGEDGQTLPATVEEITVLSDSIRAFYDRASRRGQNRFDVYLHALQKKEDRLDPPLNRYIRDFRTDVSGRFEDTADFDDLMTALFADNGAKHRKPPESEYEQLSELFYVDSRSIALFSLFIETALARGLIRKGWEHDREHRLYPGLNRQIMRGTLNEVSWRVSAIKNAEQVFDELQDLNETSDKNYRLWLGKLNTYKILAGMGWSRHVTQSLKGPYMHTYNYLGLIKDLIAMGSQFIDSDHKEAAAKYVRDVIRGAAAAALRQKVITCPDKTNLLSTHDHAVHVLIAGLEPGDGYLTTCEELQAEAREHLGVDVGFDGKSEYQITQSATVRQVIHDTLTYNPYLPAVKL